MTTRQCVLIYRNEILPPSETFIAAQAAALKRYEPHFIGLCRVKGSNLSAEQSTVVNDGSLQGRLSQSIFAWGSRLPNSMMYRLRELRPKLIHAHFLIDALWALKISQKLNIPLLVTLHGYDVTVADDINKKRLHPNFRNLKARRAELFQAASHFIAVSEFIKSIAIARGCNNNRISVLYTGVDIDRFTPMNCFSEQKTVIFVGRLIPNKGCANLIRAMAFVQRHIQEAELTVIGDGPMRAELEALAIGACCKVAFVGTKSPEDVRQYLASAAVFSVPSITTSDGASEGLGMVFLEAQAMGVPVVSFSTGGIPEAVENGVTGLLVPPGDDMALAAAIIRILSDKNLRLEFGLAGQLKMRREFSLQTQTILLEHLYDQLDLSYRHSELNV